MERIKTFIEEYAIKEAEVASRKRVPDLDAYNKTLEEYNAFLVRDLHGVMGHTRLGELRSPAQYKMFKNIPEDVPRKLFKISEYNSEKYGKVWVGFTSLTNPGKTFNLLSSAMILIEEDGQLKIAKFLSYTNYTELGNKDEPYRWDDIWGYDDLNFKNLKYPEKIERYLEPINSAEGSQQYYTDI